MSCPKKHIMLLCISIMSQVAVAQWKYTVTYTSGSSKTVYSRGPFASKAECEQNRQYDITANTWSSYIGGDGWGGNIGVKATATPCTGPGGGTIGSVDVFGISKGSSFYSTNPVNEINDWVNDDMERILALNPEYDSKERKVVDSGDDAFDDIVENISYSNEIFSGRKPIEDASQDQYTDKSFVYEQGPQRSKDLSFIKIDLTPVGPHTGTVIDDESTLSKTLKEIDTKLDYYQAKDGNLLQFLYSKGKNKVIDVGYWWNNSKVSSKVTSTLQGVANIIKSDAVSAAVKKIIPTKGEDAYDIYDSVGGSLKELIKEGLNPKVIVDKASKGETIDMSPHIIKFNDEIGGLAGRIAESNGMPNTSLKNILDEPKEQVEHQIVRKLNPFDIISD